MSEQKKKRPNSAFRSSLRDGANGRQGMSKSAPNVSSIKSTVPVTGRSKHSPNPAQNKLMNRQPSYDHVRKIVEEEGRAARNLVTWSVPIEDQEKPKQKPTDSPIHKRSQRSDSISQRSNSDSAPTSQLSSPHMQRKLPLDKQQAAAKAVPDKDPRARHWAFLFNHLRRTVDEIYQMCETDESVVECKEVIMMLTQYTKDFQSLIDKLRLLRAYEDADESNRPTSLAWEIRKSSPGKSLSSSNHLTKDLGVRVPSAGASRSLTFSASISLPTCTTIRSGNSWADRVKGTKSLLQANGDSCSLLGDLVTTTTEPCGDVKSEIDCGEFGDSKLSPEGLCEEEGWEKVQRTGKARARTAIGPALGNDRTSYQTMNTIVSNGMVRPPENAKCLISPGVEKKAELLSSTCAPVASRKSHESASEKSGIPVQQAEMSLSVTEQGKNCSESSFNNKCQGHTSSLVNGNGEYIAKETCDAVRSESNATNPLSENVDDTCADVEQPDEQPVCRRRRMERPGVGISSEDDADGEYEEDDDEVEVQDLDDALLGAMDQEDTLVSELEQEQEAALETAILEEKTLLQELAREQNREIHVDTEPDTEQEDVSLAGSLSRSGQIDSPLQMSLDWSEFSKIQEEEAAVRKSRNLTWGEWAEEDAECRTPGRAVHVHEKLLSPSRKRSLIDSKKHQEEKQSKARELREKLMAEKSERLRLLTKKVEEVQQLKNELLIQRRLALDCKQERAEQKRQIQLQLKVRKAREEEIKASEIAFIVNLENQNKRHDIMSKHQESEARLNDIQEERQRKHDEKLAKEQAAEERRKALETERQTRIQEMAERRRQRTSEFELRQLEKEKERAEAARAKEREREERLAALSKQQQAHIEELQKKIQQKQDDTDRRHKEKLEAIQEKAFRMSILHHSTEDHNEVPKLVPYEKKKICLACNVMIPSEVYLLSHLRGKKHQQSIIDGNTGQELTRQEIENFNLKHIADAPLDRPDPQSAGDKERLRVLRKRCKKLRLRLSQRGAEYENLLASKPMPAVESENKSKLAKICKDIQKYLKTHGTSSGPWPANMVASLDRSLGEISRILDKKVPADQLALKNNSCLSSLCSLLDIVGQITADQLAVVPAKSFVSVCSVLRQSSAGCYDNCLYLLMSSKLCTIVDILGHQIAMMIPDGATSGSSQACGTMGLFRLAHSPSASALMDLLSTILQTLAASDTDKKRSSVVLCTMETVMLQCSDVISYIVSLGILDKLSQYLSNIRGPVDGDNVVIVEFLVNALSLTAAIIRLVACRPADPSDKKKVGDPTQLMATLKATQLVGIVSFLYGMLLHTDAPARGETPPPSLPAHTVQVVQLAFNMLNSIAGLQLPLLQGILGEEGTSLEFRHIGSYLLWYCNHHSEEQLLHEVVLCIGHFCVLNHDNQLIIQSGQPPTVLQQLCSLPFAYFSDTRLMAVLFPTLIACCFQVERNREILEQELSCALLANYIEEKMLDNQQQPQSTSMKKLKSAAAKDEDSRFIFSARFPVESWPDAHKYFGGTPR